MKKKNKKVIVAMSGGVDSSVAAALLKRADPKGEQAPYGVNFDAIGVFMKFWAEKEAGKENRCCSPESEKRARLVAKKLDIPFYVFNFEKEFKKKVVDYFLREEKAGLTPNPCVVCNKEIKFGFLLKKLKSLDFDYIATGHYARIEGKRLLRGKDKQKDQSYFLWKLDQKQIKHILFPVGSYTKKQVRNLAKKFKLPVLEIPESQEICFVATTINPVRGQWGLVEAQSKRTSNGVNDFLEKHLGTKPGRIVDADGKVLGRHQGLWFYTIGQRRGIALPLGPYYVLGKDLKKNLLIVTKRERDIFKKELIARDVNWISDEAPKLPLKAKVQIRYKHPAVLAVLSVWKNNKIKVVFSRFQRAITPGQSVVFFKREELLGGGTIL